jgi:hypothetical protein
MQCKEFKTKNSTSIILSWTNLSLAKQSAVLHMEGVNYGQTG